MLEQFRRKKWVLVAGAVLLIVGIVVVTTLVSRRPGGSDSARREADLPAKPQAPPDLAKFRDAFAAGIAALDRKDAAGAIKQFTSIDFGSREVEEYRLHHLAAAYRLAGNKTLERRTLTALWRRKPRLVHAHESALALAALHQEHGNFRGAGEVAAGIATRTHDMNAAGMARWATFESRFASGDIGGALYAVRNIPVKNPRSAKAAEAMDVIRALTGVAEDAPLKFSAEERLERAVGLMRDGDPKSAEAELAALQPVAPESVRLAVQLNRGLALHHLRRYEDSIKVLEPLTSGPYKYAIPALYFGSKNYRIVASTIDPTIYKTITEKKKVGTVKVRVGKGKKKKLVTKPKYANVKKQIKLVDLAKKNKRDEYERLGAERLKDTLALPLAHAVRAEVLGALIERAAAKNQTDYVKTLVPELVKIDRTADPALQFFWNKAWFAFARGDLGEAKTLFRYIADTYKNVNVGRQSQYWYARTIERLGSKAEAAAIYQTLANAPYADLYAQHSVARGAKRQPPKPVDMKREDWQQIADREMPRELRLAYELTALSAARDARLEIQRNQSHANKRYSNALLADLYASSGQALLMYRTIREAWPELATVEQDKVPPYFIKLYFPMKYHDAIRKYAKENGLDPYLVMGLILQESYYNPHAKSRVGATGLMQLMPPTAKELAGQLRIPFAVSRLETPEVNIRLGTRHLRYLVNLFNGETPLAIASYNAGQGNVGKWRRAAPRKPMDEFLESIPFPETRNYVKRVTMLRASYERLTQ